jgi:hypothetical protein
VAFAADGPFSALQNIALKAVGPDLITLSGYSAYLWNRYGGFGLIDPATSTDTNIYSVTAGTGATGGSFNFRLRVPVAINHRNLIGLLGNQDAATKYQLATDVSPLSAIYTVNPTNAPTLTITRDLGFCTVPAAVDAMGKAQQQVPPTYGVLHMANELRSEAQPSSGATVNHFVRSLGNVIREFILVFRDSTGARSDALLPNRLTFRVGADVKLSVSSGDLRWLMRHHYGVDAPAGVLVIDFISDFGREAGLELGDDWFDSSNVPNAQFECVYPTFANTPGTLTVITDQLVIPAGMNVRAFV